VNRSTPLHKAVEGQSQETAELLLSYGAPVGLRSGSGSTALHIACFVGSDQPMIEMLLDHAAEINAPTTLDRLLSIWRCPQAIRLWLHFSRKKAVFPPILNPWSEQS